MDYTLIANKIEDMIKESIVKNELVKTGKLLKSIKVTPTNTGDYVISAEDYFPYLDSEYKILEGVFKSKELEQFIEKVYQAEVDKMFSE